MFNLPARLNVVLGDRGQLDRAIQDVDRSLNRGAKSARSFSDALSLKAVSFASYTAATVAVVKLTESIAKATNDALRFEAELAKIAQTFNKSNADIAKYSNSIRKISVAYGLSAPKIAETIRVLGQAGFSFDQAREAADNLAKTTLLASFESIADTTDGLIAIQKQFTSTIGQSERVLALLNTTAKKYAVESSDLVETVRKAGGVFSATGGTLEELVAIFTTVRDTTRESAETIATGLRTIFSRIQRPKSIEFFKEIGIELTNLRGEYVGNYQAIREIQDGLARQNIRPRSIAFAQVVEELGGLRQASRVIPLLMQGAKLSKIYGETQQATTEFTDDLSKAQETLAFKLAQTQQNFSKLIGDIAETSTFKALTNAALGLANAVIKVADAFRDVIPLAAAVGTISLGRSLVRVAGQGLVNPSRSRSLRRNRGGPVPGVGNRDTVPALLTPGEFVIRKSAAQAFGYENLDRVNRYAVGGKVSGMTPRLGYEDRDASDILGTKRAVDQVFNSLVEGLGNFGQSVKKTLTGITLASSITGSDGQQVRGRYYNTNKSILLSKSLATKETLAHEFGHAADYQLGGGNQASSVRAGTFQNVLANMLKSDTQNALRNRYARTYREGSPEMIGQLEEHINKYRLNEKEIFANIFASVPPIVQKMIVSTTDATKGMEILAKYVNKFPAQKLYGDLQNKILEYNQALKMGMSPSDLVGAYDDSRSLQDPEQARLLAEAKANVQRAIANKTMRELPGRDRSLRGTLGDIANERAKVADERTTRRITRKENDEIRRDPAAYLNSLNSGPGRAAELANAYNARQIEYAASERRSINHSRSFFGGTLSGGGILERVRAGTLPRDKRTRDRILASEASVPEDARAQRAEDIRVARARKRSSGIIERIRNQGGFDKSKIPTTGLDSSFGAVTAASASLVKQFIEQESAGGRFAAKLLDIVTVAGVLQSAFATLGLTIKTDTIKKFFDFFPKINTGKFGRGLVPSRDRLNQVGGIATRAAGAAAATYAVSSLLDAITGSEARKNEAIKEGNVSGARNFAIASTADDDVTKFSSAVAGATSALLEFIPGMSKLAPVLGTLTGVATKLSAQFLPFGKELVGLVQIFRNSNFGVLESNALIGARAGSEAAANNTKRVDELQARALSNALSDLQKGTLSGGDFFKGGVFRSISGATLGQAQQDKELIKQLRTQINNSTSVLNSGVRVATLGFGGSDPAALTQQLEDTQARIRDSANSKLQQFDPFIQAKTRQFVGGGGTDFNKFLDSFAGPDGENTVKQLIELGGATQQYKDALESVVALEQNRRKAVQESIRLFEAEYQLTKKRLAIQQQLDVAFSKVIATANKMNTAFSLVESSANLGGTLSIDNSASGQLGNLANITDKRQFNKVLGAVGGFPGAAEVFRGAQFGEAIKAPGGLLQSALIGQISTQEAKSRLSDPLTTPDQRESIIAGQVSNLAKSLAQFGVETNKQTQIIGDFSKLIDDKNGQVDPEDIKDLLEEALVKPAQETADKLAKVYDIQIDSLNKFGDALRVVSEAESKVREKQLQSITGSFNFANQLREIQTGKKTTAATLQEQSIGKQQQILGLDADLAGNTAGISAEIIALQKSIAQSNKSIQEDPRGKDGEILAREQNIQRMERLNQALDEQINTYGDLKSALLAVAEAEKGKATQIKEELLARTSQTRQEQISKVRGKSLADAFITGDSRFDPRQLTTLATKNLNPEAAEKISKQQELIKAEIDKVASQEGPRQQQAKDLQKKIAEAELQSKTFDEQIFGLQGLTPAQRKAADRQRERQAKQEALAIKREESRIKLEENKLKKTNPEEFARRQANKKEAENSRFAVRNEQTIKGALAERQAVGVQVAENRALGEQATILQEQVALIKTSMEPFVAAVQNLVAMPKEIDVRVNDVAVQIQHNGLEVFNSISSEIEKMILRGIVQNLDQYDRNLKAGAPPLGGIGQKNIGKKVQ